jgi:hypothetical protein
MFNLQLPKKLNPKPKISPALSEGSSSTGPYPAPNHLLSPAKRRWGEFFPDIDRASTDAFRRQGVEEARLVASPNFVTKRTRLVTELERRAMARGRKPIGENATTAAERQRRHRASEAVQRKSPLKLTWSKDGARIGRITIYGTFWGAVEWSEKRQVWCIEDAEGKCLQHAESIHGQAPTKDEAVLLAREMILDGRMPSPEQAKAEYETRRRGRYEAKQQTPSAIAARQAKKESERLMSLRWQAERKETKAQRLWEAMHDIFDFTDPDLWKSNSFAVLHPRLIINARATIAALEQKRCDLELQPRRLSAAQWREWKSSPQWREQIAHLEARIARAREVLAAMEAAG